MSMIIVSSSSACCHHRRVVVSVQKNKKLVGHAVATSHLKNNVTRRGRSAQHIRCQSFFNFNNNNNNGSTSNGLSRSDFDFQEVEDYFNYMGMLAAEGNYDRLDTLVASGVEPIDLLLLMACSENDTPKVEEVLAAGADVTVKNPGDGKTPMDLCTKEEIKEMLAAAAAR
jgi:hypothetical protein